MEEMMEVNYTNWTVDGLEITFRFRPHVPPAQPDGKIFFINPPNSSRWSDKFAKLGEETRKKFCKELQDGMEI